MASPTRAGDAGSLPTPETVYSVYQQLMVLGGGAAGVGSIGLGGRLVLYDVVDLAGAATALAASIAGAASLGIDPDVERLKQAVRSGVCDFVVNGLDEAVRILKNEIRKKNTVAVGLGADLAACLAEIVERGLQPDVLAFPMGRADEAAIDSSLDILKQRGALSVATPVEARMLALSSLARVRWSVPDSPARWLPKLTAIAAHAVAGGASPGDDRLRWLRLLPRYFPRAAYHFVPMSEVEVEEFLSGVREHTASGAIPCAVTVERDDALEQRGVEVSQWGT